jgi:NAD(P)-dependent dehydrogenase (short-subunit alcohol dehydrogenase family)
MPFENRTVVVTGAAGGIGAALCDRFAAAGARTVIAVDSDAARVEDVAAALRAEGKPVSGMVADVGDETQIRRVIGQVEAGHGDIGIFVQNAGHFEFGGPEASDDAWSSCLRVNLMAHVYGARSVLPGMLRRSEGRIVNMCSAAGLLTDPAAAPYAVSKHAAVAFAEWLAIACRGTGVRVSAVCPQSVATPMLDAFLAGAGQHATEFVGQVLTPGDVADRVLAGMAAEQFLIRTHATTAAAESAKVTERQAWIAGQPQLYDIRAAFSGSRQHDGNTRS